MRPLAEIIVHCSATKPEWYAGKPVNEAVDEIRRWHVGGNGWSDIGYHYVIDRKGNTGIGRPLARTGAHVAGHNTGTVGICLLGGHGSSADDKFADNFTPEQDDALRELIGILRAEHPTIQALSGHNDYAAKACPGFRVADWHIREPLIAAPIVKPMTFWETVKFFFGIK